MNKESKRDLLRVGKEKITRKQKKVRSRNRTYTENDFFVVTNINSVRKIKDY